MTVDSGIHGPRLGRASLRRAALIALTLTMALGGINLAARAAPIDLLVASRDTDQVLRYDGVTGAFVGVFVSAGSGGLDNPSGLTFGPDGNLYASNFTTQGGTPPASNRVIRFDGGTGALLNTFTTPPAPTAALIFGPDGDLYGSMSPVDSVFHADGTTGQILNFIGAGSPLDLPTGLSFGPDGNLYVGSFSMNDVLRFNGVTGAFIDVFATVPLAGSLGSVGDVKFGPDGNLYVTLISEGNDIWRFDGTTGASLGPFIPASDPHPDGPFRIRFGPDGNLYVSARDTDNVLRYNGTTGAFIDIFASGGGLDNPTGLAFLPEPSSLGLLVLGIAGFVRRRR